MKKYRVTGGCGKRKCRMRGKGLNLTRSIKQGFNKGVKWLKNPKNRNRYVYPALFKAGMALL